MLETNYNCPMFELVWDAIEKFPSHVNSNWFV